MKSEEEIEGKLAAHKNCSCEKCRGIVDALMWVLK